MPRRPRPSLRARPLFLAALAAALLLLVGFRLRPSVVAVASMPSAATAEPSRVRVVMPPVEWERPSTQTIAADEVHVYPLRVEAGKLLEIEVEQLGADVVLELRDQEGELLFRTDMPSGVAGPESIYRVVEEDATYPLEITALRPGEYRIDSFALRTPTPHLIARGESVALFERALEVEYGPDPAQSIPHLEAAEAALAAVGDRFRLGMMMYFRGRRQWNSGRDIKAAVATLVAAGELFGELGEGAFEARVAKERGLILQQAGYLDSAEVAYHSARQLWRKLGDERNEAVTLSSLGDLYLLLGQADDSLAAFNRALVLAKQEADDIVAARTYVRRATAYAHVGDNHRARDDLRAALSLKDAQGSRHQEADIHLLLGDVAFADRENSQALALYDYSISLARSEADGYREASALHRKAILLLDIGELEDSEAVAGHALGILEEFERPDDIAAVLAHRARVFARTGDAERMASDVERLEGVLKEGGTEIDRTVIAELRTSLARLRGNLEEAETWARKAVDSFEVRRAYIQSGTLRSSLLADRRFYYDRLISVLLQRHEKSGNGRFLADALVIAERAKARSLLDSLATLRTSGAELKDRLDQLRRVDRERRSHSGSRGHEAARRLREEALRFDRHLAASRVAAEGARDGAVNIDLPALEGRLKADSMSIVAFHLGETGGTAWVVNPSGSRVLQIPGLAYWRGSISKLHRLASSSRQRSAQWGLEIAVDETERILEPVFRNVESSRLLIVPDGPLHYLPFELLPSLSRGAENQEVVFAPSISSVLQIERETPSRDPDRQLRVVAIGDPVFSLRDPRMVSKAPVEDLAAEAGPYRLRFSAIEIDSIEAIVGSSIESYVGTEASRRLLGRLDAEELDILHFATHAHVDPEYPELSSLELSRFDRRGRPVDGTVLAAEVSTLSMRPQIVILGACETALGVEVLGEGLVGLAHSFLTAGAERVLVTRWRVDDRSTAQFMRLLYAALDRGHTAGRALRLAQEGVAATPGWGAPYFWAGFMLHGRWDPLVGRLSADKAIATNE